MIKYILLVLCTGTLCAMTVKSPAFKNGEAIPSEYTCDGQNISPPLTLLEVPFKAESLAIIMEDTDAPGGVFVHWIAWNIPPKKQLWQADEKLPVQGNNDTGRNKYFGPCPPKGSAHHYHFKVYALDKMLDLKSGDRKQLEEAMKAHVVGKAEIVGTYQKK